MNTPSVHEQDDLRYAEYVLGVLDADQRTALEQDIRDNPLVATAVFQWEQRLLPLSEELAPSMPPAYVWARIRAELGFTKGETTVRPIARSEWWNNLLLWRWIGIGASLAAAASVALWVAVPRAVPTPSTISASYMASTIKQDNGDTGWTATMDMQHERMIVVPAHPEALAQGKSPELWLIPAGKKPMSLGMIARDKPTSIALRADLMSALSATAVLAVSAEPAGGSPSGQPTGPVVAKGIITGA